jgi:hypothetical protein
MPNIDIDKNAIAITIDQHGCISVRLGDNKSPHDPQVQKNLRDILGELVDVDDVIEGLKTNQL